MAEQREEESAGRAKITKAYNLPCRYVLHTVDPVIYGTVTKTDRALLADCYRSCLEPAAEIAIQTVKKWQRQNANRIEVIFNVFKDSDYEIYKRLLLSLIHI